jgi:hypothetical protein
MKEGTAELTTVLYAEGPIKYLNKKFVMARCGGTHL